MAPEISVYIRDSGNSLDNRSNCAVRTTLQTLRAGHSLATKRQPRHSLWVRLVAQEYRRPSAWPHLPQSHLHCVCHKPADLFAMDVYLEKSKINSTASRKISSLKFGRTADKPNSEYSRTRLASASIRSQPEIGRTIKGKREKMKKSLVRCLPGKIMFDFFPGLSSVANVVEQFERLPACRLLTLFLVTGYQAETNVQVDVGFSSPQRLADCEDAKALGSDQIVW